MTATRLSWRFWGLTAAALAGVLATAALGFWQVSRASGKLALQAEMDGRKTLAVLNGAALANPQAHADTVHRRVSLRGTWLHRHMVFLDNRQMDGKPGFFVLTPLSLEGLATAVVVQRGWVQRNFVDRAQIPLVPTPAGLVEVTGRIAPPPSKLYEFGAVQAGVIRQNLDLQEFSREIGIPLAAVSVLQLDAPADGLSRDWPEIATGIQKHYAYAFQWFALCGLIVLLYVWFQIVRRFIPVR